MYALPKGPDPLDATIGECGAMNLFFVFDKSPGGTTNSSSSSGGRQLEVVTPPLDGTILPGVTRDSILQLLRK
jgi:branched-chain amino acid aminotransferase